MRALAVLSVVLGACAAPPEPLEAGTTGAGATTIEMSSGTGEPGACPGPAEDVEVEVSYQGLSTISYRTPVVIDRLCLVKGIYTYDADSGGIALRCAGDQSMFGDNRLDLRVGRPLPAAPVVIDQPVRLRVFIPGDGSSTIYAALHDADEELVLAFASGTALPGDGEGLPPADFFAPLTVAPVWDCPFECPVPGGAFIVRDCTCARRGALEFGYGEHAVRVGDHAEGVLAGPPRFDVRVTRIEALDRDNCEMLGPDDSGVLLRFLAVRWP